MMHTWDAYGAAGVCGVALWHVAEVSCLYCLYNHSRLSSVFSPQEKRRRRAASGPVSSTMRSRNSQFHCHITSTYCVVPDERVRAEVRRPRATRAQASKTLSAQPGMMIP